MNNLEYLVAVVALVSTINISSISVTRFQQSATLKAPCSQMARSDGANELIRTIVKLFEQGKFEEALEKCARVSELSPTDYCPHVLAGFIYAAQMKYRSASEAFGKATQLQPKNKELYLLKASVDSRRNAAAEALAACQKALEIDPKYGEAYAIIGRTLRWDQKRRTEAVSAFQSAIKYSPYNLGSYETLGQLLDESKDQKGAEDVFKQGLAADPTHKTGRFALGRMLVKQGRLVEARKLWEARTSDADSTFPQFIELLKRAENLKKATVTLDQKPNDPDAQIEMGLAVMDGESWVSDGRQERAIVYFRKALDLKPDYDRAQYAICKAYIQVAAVFNREEKTVDLELLKLKQLNPGLAAELEKYRKNYVGAIIGGPPVDLNK